MLSAASSVLVAAVLPVAAALNSVVQAAPPPEPAQAARAFASVFSLVVGTTVLEGFPAPGEAPVAALARLFAVANALSRP